VGFLVGISDHTTIAPDALRPVRAILDTEPMLSAEILALLQWAQRYYHHPPGEVFATALPVLLRQGQAASPAAVTPCWQITAAGQNALTSQPLQRAPAQRQLLDYLHQHSSGASVESLRSLTPNPPAILRILQQKGWVESTFASAATSTPTAIAPVLAPPVLNAAQAAAIAAVTADLGRFQVFLLEGITGSGKTEVYLRLIEAVVAEKRQALVLVPEIGLTPQMLARFRERLPGPLAVLHSGLSDRERLQTWLMARSGDARVVVGTRSAVFSPLPHLGLVIVDEEHDTSYKQQEGFRYHARDLAVIRGQQVGIPVVLGSATPALESRHNVERGRYRLLSLPERVGGSIPAIEILDIRRQPLVEGLSQPLLERIQLHLDRNEQVLLFLNRRGFAPVLFCHGCGWLSQCQHCDARMTLHLRQNRLICHHCGDHRPVDSACPLCGGNDLHALGQGTERLESALRREFPNTGIIRIDRDSTRRRGSLEGLLDTIQAGGARLLIGTQMLAKGHHFPDVTLVGIVDADQGLYGVDFRASERMAQLILQVAGRAGRADKPGVVLIQTHHPDHPLLRLLVTQGYPDYAVAALLERQATSLPPFAHQALLRAEAAVAEQATTFLRAGRALAEPIAAGVELLGPAPAPMERRAGRYRAQLLAQATQRQTLQHFLDHWASLLWAEHSKHRVRWSLDIDPIELY
jgi:primosomal protein N' (replication factor Y)